MTGLSSSFPGSPCDYFFSVINYRVLPDEILRLPEAGAINFHDGPLPGYAGMYVTTWALINGEREHGISWHWMTKEIDAGGVLKEKRFPVASDETAVTLNSKCYEAGFDAFRSLLTDLEQGTTSSRPQTGHATGGYYGLRQRPARLATLDWSRPAEELGALFRSLDFGRYENPIGCPKVVWGDRVLIPGRFTILEQQSTRPPGTFERRADSNAVARAHGDQDRRGGQLFDARRRAGRNRVFADRVAGRQQCERPLRQAAGGTGSLLERICVHESFWATRLAAAGSCHVSLCSRGYPPRPLPDEADSPRTSTGDRLRTRRDSSKFVAQGAGCHFALPGPPQRERGIRSRLSGPCLWPAYRARPLFISLRRCHSTCGSTGRAHSRSTCSPPRKQSRKSKNAGPTPVISCCDFRSLRMTTARSCGKFPTLPWPYCPMLPRSGTTCRGLLSRS